MYKWIKINLKKLVSWAIGIPSALAMFSEVEDLNYWYIPFIGAALLVAVLYWNHVFSEKEVYERR